MLLQLRDLSLLQSFLIWTQCLWSHWLRTYLPVVATQLYQSTAQYAVCNQLSSQQNTTVLLPWLGVVFLLDY